MNILGVSCFYHDSAACLISDGRVVAAASEERFNRRKNCPDFPAQAINYCLQAGNITSYDLDYVSFYEKPFLKFQRMLLAHIEAYPFSLKNFLDTMPYWLQDRLIMPLVFKQQLGFEGQVVFVKHHLSHAASAFLVSGFPEAAILTADAVGEWATLTCGRGAGTDIRVLEEIHFPDSLGLLYTAVTTYLGFAALQGEGKVMGLAGYGNPVYLDAFKKMVAVRKDGSHRIDQRYFGFNKGARMYTGKLLKLLGPDRKPDTEIEQRHCDIAASLQCFTEETLITIARHLYDTTRLDRLCLAGGLFLNCVANTRLLENTPFKEVFIQPAAGDSGGALGAATYLYHTLLKNPRTYCMQHAYLGPDFSHKDIETLLKNSGLTFTELDDQALARSVAGKIAQDKIVGWFQGRMEFGPRALGNRSILANPCNPAMKDLLNKKVKKREPFRPYAPAVLEERAGDFFEAKQFSPYMLLSASVRKDKRSSIPAVTHVDGTARVQVVRKDSNPALWRLIKEFETITGIPVLINTSFNLKGEPIVCSPREALDDFLKSGMDLLVLGNVILEK